MYIQIVRIISKNDTSKQNKIDFPNFYPDYLYYTSTIFKQNLRTQVD